MHALIVHAHPESRSFPGWNDWDETGRRKDAARLA